MNKRLFDKRCHYSIRKFAIGAASVMIGASIFGISAVQAEEVASSNTQTEETTVHQPQPLDKLPDDVAAAIAKADENGGREFVKPKAESTEDKVTKDTEPTKPVNEGNHELVNPKVETPNKVGEENEAEERQKAEETNPKTVEDGPKSTAAVETDVKEDAKKTSEKDQVKPTADLKSSSEKTQALSKESSKADVETEKQLLSDRKQDFNKDWYFKLNAQGDFSKKDVDVHDWSKLNLPHDWSIYFDFDHKSPARNEGGQLNGGTAWYRKTFTLNEADKNKDVRINFDGVYMDSKVYVNGKFVGHYPSGYNHFSYDITEFLNKDGSENSITVQVTNKQPSSRWYSGSGIYRDVTLSYRDKVHVAENGNHITTPKLAEQKNSNVETQVQSKIKNTDKKAANVFVEQQIFTKEGKAVSELVRSETKSLAENETAQFNQNILVNQPTLWTTKSYHPQLYVLKTKVYKEGQLVDVTEDTFGYRYFNWTAKEGFSLNGERMKFHGVSIHH
ncbi:MAG: YSIRK-type signal peptide-containing protein, partial [Streptococcus mitis]|nr:YSIRK-type signal peptide-containing protein [Streptococcus mitis]